jgi:TRAP-type C4-dicarboxylate transport system substrate-binding protein
MSAARGQPVAAGEPVVLRMASEAPEGSAWAREFRAFGREVSAGMRGDLQLKWYLSGVAGNELKVAERIGRDQLDGVVSAGMLCARLAPSIRAVRLPAVFRDRDEAAYVLNQMKPILDAEFLSAGFVNLAVGGLGFSVIFSRRPIHTVADLRKAHVWVWELDETVKKLLNGVVDLVPLPIDEAARAYDQGVVDGFISVPAGALAFQWSAQARYVSDLQVAFLPSCVLVARRAFDQLPIEAQTELRAAASKLRIRVEDLDRQQDETLLGGLFEKQGLHRVAASEQLRREFEEAATRVGSDLLSAPDAVVPAAAREHVLRWRASYRARLGSRQ